MWILSGGEYWRKHGILMQTRTGLIAIAARTIGKPRDFQMVGTTLLTAASDEEDETAELLRELEKIKKERAEQREKEVCPDSSRHVCAATIDSYYTTGTRKGRPRAREARARHCIGKSAPQPDQGFQCTAEVRLYRPQSTLAIADFRRWDDDVVFKNQARGTEGKRKKEFVNVSVAPGWAVLAD